VLVSNTLVLTEGARKSSTAEFRFSLKHDGTPHVMAGNAGSKMIWRI
jgi:hypothetical protein